MLQANDKCKDWASEAVADKAMVGPRPRASFAPDF
jgi:hypothetical protein